MVYRWFFLVSLASFKCNLMYYTEGRYKEREIVNGLKVKVTVTKNLLFNVTFCSGFPLCVVTR